MLYGLRCKKCTRKCKRCRSVFARPVGINAGLADPRRQRRLWERSLVDRWAFPGIRAVQVIVKTRFACVKKAFIKQVKLLEENLRHPSLRAKKCDEALDHWQAHDQSAQLSPRCGWRGRRVGDADAD